jgi:hypothetical protein
VLVGLIYLAGKLMGVIPPITGRALEILEKIQEGVALGTRSLARLVIEPISILAIFRRKHARLSREIKLKD